MESQPIIKVVVNEIRPNVEVPFYTMTPAEREYKNENFVQTGKILFSKNELSEDKLRKQTTQIYFNAVSRQEYQQDPVMTDFRIRKEEYNERNQIYTEKVEKEIN
jgi:hypothetical protein